MRRAGLGVVDCGTWVRRVVLVLVSFVAAFVLAMEARAQAQPIGQAPPSQRGARLDYHAGPCGGVLPEPEFRHEVAILMGGLDYFGDPDASDVIRVTFERAAGGLRGTVVYVNAEGSALPPRSKTGWNCELLARHLALVVTTFYLHIPPPEPDEKPPDPVPSPTGPPSPPAFVPPLVVQVLRESTRETSATEDMELTLTLSAGALMTAGLTSNVGPGVWIAGGVRGEIFSVDLELRGVLPSYVLATEPAPGTIKDRDVALDYSQWTAGLVPCVRWKYFVGCGVAHVGLGYFQNVVDSSGSLTVAVGPRIGFEVPFAERFAVLGFGEALFVPRQAGVFYDVDNDAPAANVYWFQPVVSAFFGAGLSVRFQ